MAILVGVHPGGRNKFAVCSLFVPARLPALVVGMRSHSGVEAVLHEIIGIVGIWSELTGVAIDAPLTWSGTPSGWRDCDTKLRQMLPPWAPRTWVRPPNSLTGATAVQGPALGWTLAQELRQGNLPKHKLVETHSKVSLTGVGRQVPKAVVGAFRRDLKVASRRKHIAKIIESFVDAGVLKFEEPPPNTPEELSALVSAVTALGASKLATGLVTEELQGGELRPLGRRPVAVLRGLP